MNRDLAAMSGILLLAFALGGWRLEPWIRFGLTSWRQSVSWARLTRRMTRRKR